MVIFNSFLLVYQRVNIIFVTFFALESCSPLRPIRHTAMGVAACVPRQDCQARQ
jgi:hypothetical protein